MEIPEELHDEDPFRSIAEVCRIPFPQEEHLRNCPFIFQLDDDEPSIYAGYPGGIPVASTGIVMSSAPEDLEKQKNGDNVPRGVIEGEVSHTLPEVSTLAGSSEMRLPLQQKTVASVEGDEEIEAFDGDRADDSRAVDLGRDTDLGFSQETQSTEGIEIDSGMNSSPGVCRAHESEGIYCESSEVRVSKRELTLKDDVCELPVKKLKIWMESETSGSVLGTCLRNLLETLSKLQGNSRDYRGESSTKKNLEFSTEVLVSGHQQGNEGAANNENMEEGLSDSQTDSEANGACDSIEKNAATKSIDDIDEFGHVGPSVAHLPETEKGAEGKRVLPASLLRKENATREGVGRDGAQSMDGYKELTLVDILRLLVGDNRRRDPILERLSILDCAKMRGMTFP